MAVARRRAHVARMLKHDRRRLAGSPRAPSGPRWWHVLACSLTLLTGACDFDLSDVTSALGGELIIEVRAAPAVEVGDTLRMSAIGRPSGVMGLLLYDRLLDGEWAVSDPRVATVTRILPPTGDSTTPIHALLKGHKPGTVRVTVSARGARGEATVRVVPPVAQLVATPARDTVRVGDAVEVAITALDSVGAPVRDVPFWTETQGGAWVHESWVQRYTPAALRVIGRQPGDATLTVTFRRHVTRRTIMVVGP